MLKSALGIVSMVVALLGVSAVHAQESSEDQAPSEAVSNNDNVGKVKYKKKSARKRHAVSSSARKSSGTVVRTRAKRMVIVDGKRRRVVYQRIAAAPIIPAAPTAGDLAGLNQTRDPLELKSNVALVMDQASSQILFEKNSNVALPIASITKLMMGLIVVESRQNMDEVLEINAEDVDKEKFTSSRLRLGSQLTRANLLHIALMSSENRAASALGRNYPGGIQAFVAAMNAKAKALGMNDTHYVDSTGLSSQNVASARDLAKLVNVAHQYPILCQYSTDTKYVVATNGRALQYANSNSLVSNPSWDIGLQKTGYISEAGRCLVMQTKIEGRPVVMVILDSKGKQARLSDVSRMRKWLEAIKPQTMSKAGAALHS